MKNKIQLFGEKHVRSIWDDDKEEWLFSLADVAAILSDSKAPASYWRKLKERLKKEGNETVTNCHALKLKSVDGKMRLTDVGTTEQVLRLVQSIPSPKAEPFKQWLARVGMERIEETIDPEKAIDRAKAAYLAKGMPPEWVNQRLQGIKIRQELTDAWKANGIEEQKDFALLTNLIHQETFGISVKKHKQVKGLKKENLRDNMTTMETVLTMLAEATTTEIEKSKTPKDMKGHKDAARAGSSIAKDARLSVERQTGKPVVSSQNALDIIEDHKKLTKA